MSSHKNIPVKHDTWEKLTDMKRKDESFDELENRLMNHYNKFVGNPKQ